MKPLTQMTVAVLVTLIAVSASATSDQEVVAKQNAEAVAQGATQAAKDAAAKHFDNLEALKTEKDGTHWYGQESNDAGAIGATYEAAVLGAELVKGTPLDQVPVFHGPYDRYDASMSFTTVVDGPNSHIYYLSEISPIYDSQIEKDAKGLCVNSRPREVVVQWDPKAQKYQMYVQLTKFVGEKVEDMSVAQFTQMVAGMDAAQKKQLVYTLYTVKLDNLEIDDPSNVIFNSFLPLPKSQESYVKNNLGRDPSEFALVVNYDLEKSPVTAGKNQDLSTRLAKCLDEKPWEQFTYMTPAELMALQAQK